MYTLKEVSEQVGIPYETLRFYLKEGLVPNVRRDKSNYRVFDERNIAWLKSLLCLKKCGMGIRDMKEYMDLCLGGRATIPARKVLLQRQRDELMNKLNEVHECIHFIDDKQALYDGMLAGEIPYKSNLIPLDEVEDA